MLAGWALWPQVLVRGAGFAFGWLDEVVHAGDLNGALRAVAANERFREAVTWQNRAAVIDGLDSLLRRPAGATDSRTRKKELMVVRYLQRYCSKNDTIGFFGPVGWASWGEVGRFVPAAELLSARRAFLEPWAARVIADAVASLAKSEALVWLPGHLSMERGQLLTPTEQVSVPPRWAALVTRVQRSGPLKAARLARSAEAWALLEELVDQNVLRCSFPVAISAQPLAQVTPSSPEAKALVRTVDEALEQVNRAAGTEQLGAALAALEGRFTEVTQHAPSRHAGRTYGGRGLVYEDCRRALDLTLSPQMLARVAEPLTQVLQVARWYTWRITQRLNPGLLQAFAKVKARRRSAPVPLHVFWAETSELFDHETPPAVAFVAAQVQTRMARLPAGATSLGLGAFDAPCPGWPGARHHAPDLMWAAPSAEAMLRGEGTPVLSELHPGVTPFTTLSVLAHAPDRAALERAWRDDFEPGGISPIPWEDFARSSQDARLAKNHWHLDLGYDFESPRPRGRVLRAADCVVQRSGSRLLVKHPGKGLTFDAWQVFERRIKLKAATAFSLSDGSPTGPRRSLGGLVVQRAHWRFEPAAFGWLEEAAGRVDRARAFCQAHSMPSRVFMRSPTEIKPLYLDWNSPILLEVLARLVRQTPWLSFSEMVPGPGELWLRNASGEAFVSEFRSIAVDPAPWNPAKVWARKA